ncbi:MAG: cytochrome c peroxidase [Bacteroidota bacterium]
MKRLSKHNIVALFFLICAATTLCSFSINTHENTYAQHFLNKIELLQQQEIQLTDLIYQSDLSLERDKQRIREQLQATRNMLKPADFWLRYLNTLSHKKINGPLPVEWETEVFEKFEKPYKREGAGFTLAYQYLEEEHPDKSVLLDLVQQAKTATDGYTVDSITHELQSFHHFYFCNRLFLLNLAAIYTTGFDCPDASAIVPELRLMLTDMLVTYKQFNSSFPETPLSPSYLELYTQTINFANAQPASAETFDHYTFIREFINPLYTLNQQHIITYRASSKNLLDYALNKQASSIFSKLLYNSQNPKGIFIRLTDSVSLVELEKVGKQLFYDPILSQNNQRSCVSCHNPNQYFTDTSVATSFQFNHEGTLKRNTPSLLNAQYNHLLMADGNHYSLLGQTKGVITNALEMGSTEEDVVRKVMSCKEYAKVFSKLLKYTPQEKEVTLEHIGSAITFYYGKFSKFDSPFDEAMNKHEQLTPDAQKGFNLFMGKAQCATGHFVPQFNGVKPPYIGSEFEVIGVPASPDYASLSEDKGRYVVNPATETMNAFRTGTIRNAAQTQPYMHNGVFKTLDDVIEFYNRGGGAGKGLHVPNQTLPSDSLQLTGDEKGYLVAFIQSLTEKIQPETPPAQLPVSKNKLLNQRKVGGTY